MLGGIALILFGIHLVRRGFQKLAGPHQRTILNSLTSNRFKSFAAGFLITVLSQSSTATALMVINFMASELLPVTQSIAIMLGADVGTTIAVQLLAFRMYDYAAGVVAVGVVLYLFTRSRTAQGAGQGILGFGLVFLALKLMSEATLPMKDSETIRLLLVSLGNSPLICLLVSAGFTVLVQSSAATIGIALALATHGLMPVEHALPVVLGANLGNSISPLTASRGNVEARRVAIANCFIKCLGVLIVFLLLPHVNRWIALTSAAPTRQIANAHTLFNLALAAVFLPLTSWLAKIAVRVVSAPVSAEKPFGPKYLQKGLLDSPALALGQAARETLHMGDIVAGMVRDTIHVFAHDDDRLRSDIEGRDDRVDLLDKEIKLYLTRITSEGLTHEEGRRKLAILGFVHELESIGDIVDKNLMELAKKKIHNHYHFSKEGWAEIQDFHAKVMENMEIALGAFTNRDKELARKLLHHKEQLGDLERALRQKHLDRLQAGVPESIDTTSVHLDVLSNLKRINSLLTAVAYPILENGTN